jgi:hypothetical protein
LSAEASTITLKLKTQNSELIATLIARAEAAEEQASLWEAKAHRAQRQAKLAIARRERAETRAHEWEAIARRVQAAEEQASAILQLILAQRPDTTHVALENHDPASVPDVGRRRDSGAYPVAPEYHDPAGVCRVCNQPIPHVLTRRRDGLRVCEARSCRKEARRRDRAAKQSQQRDRRRQRRKQSQQGG